MLFVTSHGVYKIFKNVLGKFNHLNKHFLLPVINMYLAFLYYRRLQLTRGYCSRRYFQGTGAQSHIVVMRVNDAVNSFLNFANSSKQIKIRLI